MPTITLTDPTTNKKVKVKNPYGKKAKEIYKKMIDKNADPFTVLPDGLKYYPVSGQIRQVKSTKPKIELRTSFKNYLGEFTIRNNENLPEYEGFKLTLEYIDTMKQYQALHGGIKVQLYTKTLMRKYVDGTLLTEDTRWVNSKQETITNPDQVKGALTAMTTYVKESIPELEAKNGSMWQFARVLQFDLSIAKYQPTLGGSYIPLPPALAAKRAIVNVKNADQECFKWSVLSAFAPAEKNNERVNKYNKIDPATLNLDFSKTPYPTSLQDIARFEKRNNMSINVYGSTTYKYKDKKTNELKDRASPYVIQKSTLGKQTDRTLNLLMLQDDTNTHYCWIKEFSRFCGNSNHHNHGGKQYFCHYCMKGYGSQEKLNQHVAQGCQDITTCKPCMPKKDEAFVKFKNLDKHIRAPYVIYADFECLTKKIDSTSNDPSISATEQYQEHESSGFTMYVVGHQGKPSQFKPYEYRGPNVVDTFISVLNGFENKIMEHIKSNTPMVMTPQDEQDFQEADRCHLCREPLIDPNDRVRDHCHLTGKYRGAAHSKCNLLEGNRNTRNYKIPVLFHNLKNYDGHLIISKVGEHVSKLEVIPQNQEKYISFTYNHLRFLDSAAFLAASLDTLSSNLYAGGAGKSKFKHSIHHCKDKDHVDLLLQKGVYPYDYMDSWERFDETCLPPIEEFYSQLNDSDISTNDYKHGQNVWETFKIKNLGEYHDLYMTTDVLLLADIFENFREICLRDYELDPCHYFTLPNFAWDCMLKKTGVKLDLLTDYDMHLMMEQGLRGGISMISHRYAKANNPYLNEYDETKPNSYISYLDANNLYGHAMLQKLPIKDFQWCYCTNIKKLIHQYGENGIYPDQGCFVKVDLQYPKTLHDEHNDYPLAPERKLVKNEELSQYQQELQQKLNLSADSTEKLVPNLQNKVGYVADIRNIEYYIAKGLKVTKVHKAVTFHKEAWLAPYINFNTGKRAKAANDFEKDFYKLMNNAVFGKTMENLRNRVDIQFITKNEGWGKHGIKNDSTVTKKLASPLYDGHIVYSENLAAVKMKKKALTLNKPIYAGMAILDLSKLHMYKFHYDYIRPKYGDKAQLLMTDTDSLCYHITTEDFFKDMQVDGHLYDMSNFTNEFYDATNKKVVGKFKDEWDGIPVKEFVGLRPKMYSMISDHKEKKTGKGIKRSHLKDNIHHIDYAKCISSNETADQQQLCEFNCIRSKRHQLGSFKIRKVGLSCYDNKRYILDDGISSLAYGHYNISELI